MFNKELLQNSDSNNTRYRKSTTLITVQQCKKRLQ